jgi:glycosyltransferase involved in cell wall biosynthesis
MTAPVLSVCIPCFNEAPIIEATVGRLLAELPAAAPSFEVVLCDDGSGDDTSTRLQKLAAQDPRIVAEGYPVNRGAGRAFRTALARARGEIVVHMDADLAMDPVEVVRAVTAGLATHDLVVCSRYKGVAADYPLHRRLPSLAYRMIYRGLLGLPVEDAMSGFFGLRRRLLEALPPLVMDGFEVYLELFAGAHRRGFSLLEVPVRFVHQTGSGEVSVLATAPRQLRNTLRVWRRLAGAAERGP